MKTKLTLLAVFAAFGVHAAIKKAEDTKPAENAPGGGLLDELLKRKPKDGKLELKGAELEQMMRELLEKQGVPKEELKDAKLHELMKRMQEKNPDGPLGEMFGFMDEKLQKKLNDQFKGMLEAHRPGAAKAAPATFTFRDGKKPKAPLALGAGVNAAGWVLTKASEVKGAAELQCEVKGAWVAAKVVRVWDDHDLALVKLDAKEIPAVQWAGGAAPGVGSFITAVAPEGGDPVAIGVVSVAVRNLQTKGRGFLGVGLDADEKGLKVREVVPGGAAGGAGVQKDDRILELDGQKPDSVFTFTKLISDHKAGEKVKLKLQRGGDVMEKEIQLGDRGAQPGAGRNGGDKMSAMGGTVSKRKSDFPSVLQTDLPLEANQCGGPVTDLDGNVVGLVIARSGRVETMVIPSETIRQALANVDFAKEEAAAK